MITIKVPQDGVLKDYLTKMFGGYELPNPIQLDPYELDEATLECCQQHPEETFDQFRARAIARLAFHKYGQSRDAIETDGAKGVEGQSARNLAYIHDTLKNGVPVLDGAVSELRNVVTQLTDEAAKIEPALLGLSACTTALTAQTAAILIWLKSAKEDANKGRAEVRKYKENLFKWESVWRIAVLMLLSLIAVRAHAQLDGLEIRNNGSVITNSTNRSRWAAGFAVLDLTTNITCSISAPGSQKVVTCSASGGGSSTTTTGTGFWHNTSGSLDAASRAVDVSSSDITGILIATSFGSLTGDVTSAGGTYATALKSTGTAGTYQQVVTDAQGRVTSGVTRTVSTTSPLGGGGALTSDLTLTCTGCLTSVTAHNLFSATHGDTVAASPVRGDMIIANSTPAWTKLALGAATAGKYAKSNGTDVVISSGSASGTGACGANTWSSTLNADSAPTCTQPAFSNISGTIATAQGGFNLDVSGIAKGGLVTGSAAGTFAIKAVGANGTLLTPDSSVAGGLKYIDFPDSKYIPAASCVNSVAGSAWSTSSTPASLCRAGTNNKDALLSPWGASDVGYFKVHLPKDCDTAGSFDISIDLTSTDATNNHTIIMQASTSFAKGDGTTTDDVAFNTAQAFGTVTLNGNANRTWNATLTGLTTTGIACPGIMWVKISRTTDSATNVGVYGANVDIPRLLAVQAN